MEDRNTEEETKEVNIEDLVDNKEEVQEDTKKVENIDEQVEEEEQLEPTKKEEKTEEIEILDEKPSKSEKNNKKTLYIIIGLVVAIIVVIVIALVLLLPKKDKEEPKETPKETSKNSAYVETIEKSLESGDLVTEINKALNDNDIETDKVSLLSMDIDSDEKQELVAYAEDNSKKYLIQFEVRDEVVYEDSFQLDSKDSIGYTYSTTQDENYWYTTYSGNYTIIKSQKTVIKEETYMAEFFTIVNTYKNVPILNNAVEYKLDKDLDAKELEENEITEELLLKDNNIKKNEIKAASEKHFNEIKEAEEKKKKEEEEKKKAEEEAAKKEEESKFKLEEKTLHYGKYISNNSDEIEYLIINSNGSGEIDGNSCTWNFGTHNFAKDSAEDEEDKKESVNFTCTDGEYSFTSSKDNILSDGGEIELKYEG